MLKLKAQSSKQLAKSFFLSALSLELSAFFLWAL
jgi:hypothetical protein